MRKARPLSTCQAMRPRSLTIVVEPDLNVSSGFVTLMPVPTIQLTQSLM